MLEKNNKTAEGGSIAADNITNSELHTHHHTGFTLEEYDQALSSREKEIRTEFATSLQAEKADTREEIERRVRLQIELDATQEKLSNIEVSYAETLQLLSESNRSLNDLKEQLPSEVFKKAEEQLQEGNTNTAYEAFAKLADEGSKPIAQAAYEAARLAENNIRYSEANRYYTKTILLDEKNPDYLNRAGVMANTLGDYRRADSLLQEALTIRKEPLGEAHPNTATSYNNVAANLNAQGRYEDAEPLYRKALKILQAKLPPEHPTIKIVRQNLNRKK